jgi:S-DNA-T family DNA segregation ATPase FtsK/SpoIIIE
MQTKPQSPFELPANHDSESELAAQPNPAVIPPMQPTQAAVGAAGYQAVAPSWWQAFVVDKGVTSTRTPERFLRDRNGRPPASQPDSLAPVPRVTPAGVRPRVGPRSGASAPKAALPTSVRLRAEPVQEPAVRNQIAELRSAYASSQPTTQTPEPTPAPEVAQPTEHSEAPAGAIDLPIALPAASISWQPSPYRVGLISLKGSIAPSSQTIEHEPDGTIEEVAIAQAESTHVETPASSDLDSGYLFLYGEDAPTPTPRLEKLTLGQGASKTLPQVNGPSLSEGGAPEPAHTVIADEIRETPVARPIMPVPPVISAEPRFLPAPVRILPPRSAINDNGSYEFPHIEYLAEPPVSEGPALTEDILEETAGRVEKTIRDFGVKGEVVHVRPGPVVTLYELEPAPGTKSSRVVALSDDIARSMSAVSARVAVIPGRNAIGIELPNQKRETVFLRELLASEDFETSKHKLPLCLGKTIGGEPVIADLARMPHLLVAGTTGSGKSVAINTMILSLLYRFTPEECRLIMVDPKMLELSVYDGIPHLLTPVVTDPKKAIIALRWAVREMEDRYKKMSKLGVRNIDGFNARVSEAKARGEVITRTVQTGFDKETGEAVYEDEIMDLHPLPYIVVIVDEMADLMMVAGKDIEGAIQRLAQMARAAGIHVILATQRPSVDVITGTIKANFPTRISFQVTSKIDSRTILGEMGAEQLLGQGDMLYMAGGGRITRVHGPFCSDEEVEKVVAHLKRQGKPVYLDAVTAEDEEDEAEDTPVFDEGELGLGSGDAYDQAVAVVLRHKKASTSYIQRRLQIGYNRAASIMERMEKEGIVGPANHAGKRDILMGGHALDED